MMLVSTSRLNLPRFYLQPIKRTITIFKPPTQLKDPSLFKQQSFVDGTWLDAQSKSTFEVENPATGQPIGTCPDLSVTDLKPVIEAASKAFKIYQKTSAKERHDLLQNFHQLINESIEDLTNLIVLENGKAISDARNEVKYAASFVDWFSAEALRTYGEVIPATISNQRNLVIKQPIGVVAALCPWNFPAAMITRKVAPALAAGCSVIVKVPAETPFTGLALAELSKRAGYPSGVLNVITTDTNTQEIGQELCENSVIRKLSFTGSTNVGKLLMKQSSNSLKKLSFELGGNAPFIVFEDADIDLAVEGAIASKFRCSGQTCVSANRFFIHSSIYAEFATKLTIAVSKFKVGSGLDSNITHGPLINLKSQQKVLNQLNLLKSNGAKVLIGGRVPINEKGYFFEPTVVSDVSLGLIDQEETFGPIAALYKFETEAEVIELSNQTDVGLSGYFYSKDIGRIWRVAEALEVGMVGVNTGIISNAMTPFGGVKESGFGREGSKYGIDEYMVIKYIAMGGL
ncbi:hypothetical protein CROQUDRAFT_663131 [Cronartium quercuum f. sp. fusiforme G11]|uniref:succinate-semialdehyde dehydrogenase [NAD(P)(+)] n=1 Tax=Cronartium quercuum f. sp. fusiforme G11 TaxID=708437 RepID=A0A9P6T7F2_9BASI|nr:hypothetical protein CROQUDRAFT_663131 [Cronartium quercuum f. sp. fusiforme G11]